MKTFLVTRPNTEAKPTGKKLEALGHRVLYAPMLNINPVSFEIPHESRSLILTSKNGARFGLANIEQKDRPIFAVGEQTAAIARSMGFTNITVGPGTARRLVPLLLECGLTQKRAYTHLCGNELAYNICAVLQDQGISADTTLTYQTTPNRAFSMAVAGEMDAGKVDAVLFYSPRTATIFEETISETGHHDWLPKLDAYCFSARVADELLGPWRTVQSAVLPTEKALFGLFKET